ncbi:MAG: SAF domain-containing protein [Egibacteraceae bacterium]
MIVQQIEAERAEHDGQATRPLRRRRGLPSGRAVVGGFLVAAAAVGVFAAYTNAMGPPTSSYLVAVEPAPAGDRLEASDLALVAMELPPEIGGQAYTDPAAVVGAVTVAPLGAGELIQTGDIAASSGPPAPRELSFRIDAAKAVQGSLQTGERIDVLATYGTGPDGYTLTVAGAVPVLGVESAGGELGTQRELVVRVGVDDPADALALAHAVANGQMMIVRATAASDAATVERYRPSEEEGGP